MKLNGIVITVAAAALLGVSLLCSADKPKDGKKKILLYSESLGFRHSVVARPLSGEMAHAEKVFKEMCDKAGYEVHFSQSFHDLKDIKQFENYDAIVFYTSGNPEINRQAMLDWLKAGGAFIGVHATTDSYRKDAETASGGKSTGWPEYIEIIGGAFSGHGKQDPNGVTIKIEDREHPATRMLGEEWIVVDEIYHHDRIFRDKIHVLMSVDTKKTNLEPQGMKPDGDYPLAWTNTYGQGRVFYTAMGHREDMWTNPTFQEHLLGGIAWALGKK
ncbi:MAG: ThuA domain-containing protein [Phycisphaerales bacterium]|nr:ThuA domain-containing protein [Phycisphaerales bacterium]